MFSDKIFFLWTDKKYFQGEHENILQMFQLFIRKKKIVIYIIYRVTDEGATKLLVTLTDLPRPHRQKRVTKPLFSESPLSFQIKRRLTVYVYLQDDYFMWFLDFWKSSESCPSNENVSVTYKLGRKVKSKEGNTGPDGTLMNTVCGFRSLFLFVVSYLLLVVVCSVFNRRQRMNPLWGTCSSHLFQGVKGGVVKRVKEI